MNRIRSAPSAALLSTGGEMPSEFHWRRGPKRGYFLVPGRPDEPRSSGMFRRVFGTQDPVIRCRARLPALRDNCIAGCTEFVDSTTAGLRPAKGRALDRRVRLCRQRCLKIRSDDLIPNYQYGSESLM